jgi:hypothetical protein
MASGAVVAVGGGHGLPRVLQALRQLGVAQITRLAPGCVSFAATPEKVRELQGRMEGIAAVIIVDEEGVLVCDFEE